MRKQRGSPGYNDLRVCVYVCDVRSRASFEVRLGPSWNPVREMPRKALETSLRRIKTELALPCALVAACLARNPLQKAGRTTQTLRPGTRCVCLRLALSVPSLTRGYTRSR